MLRCQNHEKLPTVIAFHHNDKSFPESCRPFRTVGDPFSPNSESLYAQVFLRSWPDGWRLLKIALLILKQQNGDTPDSKNNRNTFLPMEAIRYFPMENTSARGVPN